MKKLFFFFILPLALCVVGCADSDRATKSSQVSIDRGPQRAPNKGFTWERLEGAGLVMWAQRSPKIYLQTDAFAQGVRLCRHTDNGVSLSEPLVRVFDLQSGRIESLLPYLKENPRMPQTAGSDSLECTFKQVESGRNGVRRYVLAPTEDLSGRKEPIPYTCGGWGIGNSGMRYFEIFADYPNRAVFVEMGQNLPLFDETSIQIHDSIVALRGQLVWGHEVHAFTPVDEASTYWLIDKTQRLEATYEAVLGGIDSRYTPVSAQLKMRVMGTTPDGFAAEYDGVMEVLEIDFMEPIPTE